MTYRGRVYKDVPRNRWVYEVYENGELITRGDFATWIESFAQAAGMVEMYDYYFGAFKPVRRSS